MNQVSYELAYKTLGDHAYEKLGNKEFNYEVHNLFWGFVLFILAFFTQKPIASTTYTWNPSRRVITIKGSKFPYFVNYHKTITDITQFATLINLMSKQKVKEEKEYARILNAVKAPLRLADQGALTLLTAADAADGVGSGTSITR